MFVVKSWQIFYGIWYVPLKYNTSYLGLDCYMVLIIDKHLQIGALQCLVPWKIRLLAHFPWQMLQFGNSNYVNPPQLPNAHFRRIDDVNPPQLTNHRFWRIDDVNPPQLAFRGLTLLLLPHCNICQTCSLTFQVCLLSLRSSRQTWKVREHVWHKVLLCSNPETLIYSIVQVILEYS